MLTRRPRRVLRTLLLAVTCLPACAQMPCSRSAVADTTAKVTELQRHFSSVKVGDLLGDVPEFLQRDTSVFKQSLANAVQAILACESTATPPAALQATLAQALKANLPQQANTSAAWGGDLRVTVDAIAAPHLLRVQLRYAIDCGDDNLLLLFAPQQNHWAEKLLWQSPHYQDDRGAFGDFFLTAILPGASPADWRIVVAHGKPWCASRFSGFAIDVLAPASDPAHPNILWHTDRDYSRADFAPTLKAVGDTFELRTHADEMAFDIDHAFERPVIYRYRLAGATVTRIEPIATTGRGFVEEWLSMPWQEAKDQTLPTSAGALQRLHQTSDPNKSAYTSWTAGPVRSCSAPGSFQVAFESQFNKIVPGKPGGEQEPPVPYYFQIKQISDGYQMESASPTPDATCTGPNLMAAH